MQLMQPPPDYHAVIIVEWIDLGEGLCVIIVDSAVSVILFDIQGKAMGHLVERFQYFHVFGVEHQFLFHAAAYSGALCPLLAGRALQTVIL